jgi:GxxExxY protein
MTENEIGKIIIDCALKVHKELGPGLLESTYEACLLYELQAKGLKVEEQKVLPVVYKEVKLDCGYRIDLLTEDKVIIEIKSVEALNEVHMAQILTYLRLSGCRLGFLINFNVVLLKQGIKRVVNNLPDWKPPRSPRPA